MKKTGARKLSLHRETVALLSAADFTRIAGGLPPYSEQAGCFVTFWSYDSCPRGTNAPPE